MSTTAPRRAEPATAPPRLRGVLAYAAFPMIGAVTPLLAIPAISQQFGAPGWASIAVGQSVGAAASVAVELGWGLTGPQAVAATDRADSLGVSSGVVDQVPTRGGDSSCPDHMVHRVVVGIPPDLSWPLH